MTLPATVPPDYATRILLLRLSRGLTQTEFARALGVSFCTVNRWERNRHAPRPVCWRQLRRFSCHEPL